MSAASFFFPFPFFYINWFYLPLFPSFFAFRRGAGPLRLQVFEGSRRCMAVACAFGLLQDEDDHLLGGGKVLHCLPRIRDALRENPKGREGGRGYVRENVCVCVCV